MEIRVETIHRKSDGSLDIDKETLMCQQQAEWLILLTSCDQSNISSALNKNKLTTINLFVQYDKVMSGLLALASNECGEKSRSEWSFISQYVTESECIDLCKATSVPNVIASQSFEPV